MQLVRVLPSAEDEINAACFHPRAGGGIAYGTKEGRLRVIAVDRSGLAEEAAPAPRAAAPPADAAGAADAHGGGQGSGAEVHPTQRELDSLRDWVTTQQWLQQQALGGGGGGAPPPPPPA